MSIEKEIKKRLQENIDLEFFELNDFTGRHLNHNLNEGGFHLKLKIVSKAFEGKTLIDRHRLVYKLMGKLMKHEIHALSMETLTLDEWDNI